MGSQGSKSSYEPRDKSSSDSSGNKNAIIPVTTNYKPGGNAAPMEVSKLDASNNTNPSPSGTEKEK